MTTRFQPKLLVPISLESTSPLQLLVPTIPLSPFASSLQAAMGQEWGLLSLYDGFPSLRHLVYGAATPMALTFCGGCGAVAMVYRYVTCSEAHGTGRLWWVGLSPILKAHSCAIRSMCSFRSICRFYP